ncbi:MAG: diguanylate cyclase [Chloroflexi bacterium]|nr:diguanylate cyclase [Chloroflexota bacterium]
MDQYFLFVILAPIAAIISIWTAVYAWHRRLVSGAWMLSLALLAITGWLFSSTLELTAATAQATILIAKLSYLFILSAPIFLLGFALEYTGKEKWISYPRFILFWIIPTITFFLVQTNDLHGLIWFNYSVVPVNQTLQVLRITAYGSWFWLQAAYNYSLIITGVVIISNQYIRANILYRKQMGWIILGAVSPLTFNLIYILRLIPTLKKDFSPLAFAFACLSLAIGIFRHRLLDIMPIARNTIIENMEEGMIVLDIEGRMIDINPVARRLLFPSDQEVTGIGASLIDYLPTATPSLAKDDQKNRGFEFAIEVNERKRLFEGKLSSLRDFQDKCIGYLLILQDITEQKKLYQEIERLASRDTLTDLNNRRHLFSLGEKEIDRAKRYKHPISLLIIDIDFFKEINDTYGHVIGDQILKRFSFFLQSTLRSVDIIGRYGGDEFIVILPQASLNTAHITAFRLCCTTDNNAYHTEAEEIHITLSIGLSSESNVTHNTNLHSLLERADRALYLAKSRGRNQVALEETQKNTQAQL